MKSWQRATVNLLAGILFAVGLGISGALLPYTIQGFLDFFGQWNSALLFLLGAGSLTFGLIYFLSGRRIRPILADAFARPRDGALDLRLILGASLFGAGWGLVGPCPGPSITAALWNSSVAWFLLALLIGIAAGERLSRAAESKSPPAASPSAFSRT